MLNLAPRTTRARSGDSRGYQRGPGALGLGREGTEPRRGEPVARLSLREGGKSLFSLLLSRYTRAWCLALYARSPIRAASGRLVGCLLGILSEEPCDEVSNPSPLARCPTGGSKDPTGERFVCFREVPIYKSRFRRLSYIYVIYERLRRSRSIMEEHLHPPPSIPPPAGAPGKYWHRGSHGRGEGASRSQPLNINPSSPGSTRHHVRCRSWLEHQR